MQTDHSPLLAKVKIQVEPTLCADEAVKQIFQFLLAVMEYNLVYLAEDSDIEYLHNLRVANRKSRVLLTEAKAVLPAAQTMRFKRDLKFLGQLSNALRDLDVYLLEEERQKAMLSDELQDEATLLFAYLRNKRDAELLKTVALWESEKARGIFEEWGRFLEEERGGDETAVNADKPIAPLAKGWIWRRYRRVIKNGRNLLRDGDQNQYHRLRIHCKKLRYGMEFFASMFSPDEVEALIQQLKQLQDNLGLFNDLHMQRRLLLQIKTEMEENGRFPPLRFVVIEKMLQTMEIEQTELRNLFASTFSHFSSPTNKKAFRLLFKR